LARERFDRWARQTNLRPQIAAETAGNEAVLALARLGLGLGLVPRLVLENSPFAEGLQVAEPEESLGDYDLGFVMHSRRLRGLLSSVYPEGRWS
jgi:LysR family positive regulator for ilvC